MGNKAESLVHKGSFWLPRSASTMSDNVDLLYNVVTWVSTLIFVTIVVVGIYFLVKYRRSSTNLKAEKHVVHNTALELSWTIIPLIILMGLFAWGYKDYLRLSIPPADAMVVNVTGKKWFWQFNYPREGKTVLNELVVPEGRAIKLVMTSEDVIHSFYVPNFRIKKDVVPNHYTTIWFEAKEAGIYNVFCTEYCGDGHSAMLATLKVLSQADYEKWLVEGDMAEDMPMDKLGEKLYASKACNTCHSIDGSAKVGPSWKGLFGKTRTLANGSSVVADENYIRESMTAPNAKVAQGFSPVMPTYAGVLKDKEITALIEYIKTLK